MHPARLWWACLLSALLAARGAHAHAGRHMLQRQDHDHHGDTPGQQRQDASASRRNKSPPPTPPLLAREASSPDSSPPAGSPPPAPALSPAPMPTTAPTPKPRLKPTRKARSSKAARRKSPASLTPSPSPPPPPGPPPPPSTPALPLIQPRSADLAFALASAVGPAPVWPVRANARRVSTLVVTASLCDTPSDVTPEAMRARWLTEHASPELAAAGTFQDLLQQCSYGGWRLDPEDNVVVPFTVPLPCNGTGSRGAWRADGCRDVERYGWAEAALEYVRQHSAIEPAAFAHKFFILPAVTGCDPGTAAIAQQGCGANCYVWSFGETSPRALAHEWGHNINLKHAWSWPALDEYGDEGDLMAVGPSPVCFNAAQAKLAGVAAPIAVLDGSALPPGVWQPLALPASALTPVNYVEVRADWDAGTVAGGTAGSLFLQYKLAVGMERGLPQHLSGRVHIHSYTPDPDPARRNYTLQLGAVGAGQRWPPAGAAGGRIDAARYPWRLLVVATATPTDGGSAVGQVAGARVCRYTASEDECGAEGGGSTGSGGDRGGT